MSAYTNQVTKFKDEACLVKALADNGYTQVEVHEQAQTLIDYHGKPRPQKANVIIRRIFIGGPSNDVGFVKNSDGYYEAIISDYDKHKHNQTWMTNLTKSYGKYGLIKQSARMGLMFAGQTIDAKGRTQLKFAVAG